MRNENGTNNEFTSQGDVKSNEDSDRRVVGWLNSRVPDDVPSEVAGTVRSAIAAKLEASNPVAMSDAQSANAGNQVVRRRRPSLGVVTTALIVLTIGVNVLVAWRSDQRIAVVVGDHGERFSDSRIDSNERAARKISVAALFEFNVNLIQRELNHERIESSRIGFDERRQPTGSTEKGHPQEIPDRSGAAVRPRSGLQRVPKLAGFIIA